MLNIPHNTRKAFSRHFIKQAFVELRFAPVDLKWEEVYSKLKTRCEKSRFSNVLKALATQVSLKAEMGAEKAEPIIDFAHEIQGIDLLDGEGGLSVQIRRDRLIVGTSKYTTFENLWKAAGECFALAKEVIGVGPVSWFGIRKINVVGVGVKDGIYQGEGFNEAFFSPLRQGKFADGAVRHGETKYILSENEVTCLIKLEFSQQANKDRFDAVFDIDLNKGFETALAFEGLHADAKELNEKLFDIFCWVVARDLKQSLDA